MSLPMRTRRIRKMRNLTDNSTELEQDLRILPRRVLNLWKSTLILKIWLKKRLILIENSREWCLWVNSNNKPKTWSSRKNLLDLSTWFNPRLWMSLPMKTKRIRKTRNLIDNSTELEQDSRLNLKIWLLNSMSTWTSTLKTCLTMKKN